MDIRYPFINYYHIDSKGLDRAIGFCASTNISAPDCLHLATAIEAGCDVLVTTDEHFLKEARAYIETSRPDSILAKLKTV